MGNFEHLYIGKETILLPGGLTPYFLNVFVLPNLYKGLRVGGSLYLR